MVYLTMKKINFVSFGINKTLFYIIKTTIRKYMRNMSGHWNGQEYFSLGHKIQETEAEITSSYASN